MDWLINQGRKFYNILMQKWIEDNDILMYSTYIGGKSVVAEPFKMCKKWQLMIVNLILVPWIS